MLFYESPVLTDPCGERDGILSCQVRSQGKEDSCKDFLRQVLEDSGELGPGLASNQ